MATTSKDGQRAASAVDPDTWVELESDPGLFSLLIEDFGVRGVQVEEIYDLNAAATSLQNTTVYGFIFLFKWVEARRRARATGLTNSISGTVVKDERIVNNMFYAHQIVTNACATHALLSILLNCDESIELGQALTEFKEITSGMTPEEKGEAIGNSEKLAWAHNKHVIPNVRRQVERDKAASESGRGKSVKQYRSKLQETFHFISYLPINGRLYELDGLKEFPVDHGEIPPGMIWTHCFENVISERIDQVNTLLRDSNEIRYNLMALVPSKVDQLKKSLDILKRNKQILRSGLLKLLNTTDPELVNASRKRPLDESQSSTANGDAEMKLFESGLVDAAQKSSANDLAYFCAPLSMVKADGRETVVDTGVSNGVDDQSVLKWSITDCELVTVKKNADTSTSREASTSGASMRPDLNTTASSHLAAFDKVAKIGNHIDPDLETGGAGSSKGRSSKTAVVVKLETSGTRKLALLGPRGLATCIMDMKDRMKEVKRLFNDEMAIRHQWKIDDQRRTHDYDPFIRTFLAMLVEQGIVKVPQEPSPKNTKVKYKRDGRGAGRRGRKNTG